MALAINSLGIMTIYGAIVIPSFELAMVGQVYYKAAIGNITENALYSGSHGLFVLGLTMFLFKLSQHRKESRPDCIQGTDRHQWKYTGRNILFGIMNCSGSRKSRTDL